MTHQFAVGQKVKIKEGGWGFHPIHVGKIVTIHSITSGGRYTTEETLSDVSIHSTHFWRETSVDGRSFEAITVESNADKIRAINVKIKDKEAQAVALTAEQETLKHERQRLIAALLKELDA